MNKNTIRLGVILVALIASASYAITPFDAPTTDTLTLTIVNNSAHTIIFDDNMSVHGKHTFGFRLDKHSLAPGEGTLFHAKALVSPSYTFGLGGTLFFHTKDNPRTVNFIVGDSALGWNHYPMIGLGTNSPDGLGSTLSNVSIKKNPRSYDLSVKTGTVSIWQKFAPVSS